MKVINTKIKVEKKKVKMKKKRQKKIWSDRKRLTKTVREKQAVSVSGKTFDSDRGLSLAFSH